MRRRRRGRKRLPGPRYASGDRKREAITPAMVAATMPHRKGLGALAADQRAETVLGRLVLRGTLTPDQGLAGETYLQQWRGYVATIAAPQQIGHGEGRGGCEGCDQVDLLPELRRYCRCYFRRRIYEETRGVLLACGRGVALVTHTVCCLDSTFPEEHYARLAHGLTALAMHFGLQRREARVLGKTGSRDVMGPDA